MSNDDIQKARENANYHAILYSDKAKAYALIAIADALTRIAAAKEKEVAIYNAVDGPAK